jgi:hypothetical protein
MCSEIYYTGVSPRYQPDPVVPKTTARIVFLLTVSGTLFQVHMSIAFGVLAQKKHLVVSRQKLSVVCRSGH